jgi:DNA-binding MarR family transcriptional regulator
MPATATKPRPLRRAHDAVPVDPAQYEEWYSLAIATPGLKEREAGVLRVLYEHYRQLHQRGYGMQLSRDAIARHLDIESEHVRGAMHVLVEEGLVAIQRRGAGRSHLYVMTLPRKLAAALHLAGADDDILPF